MRLVLPSIPRRINLFDHLEPAFGWRTPHTNRKRFHFDHNPPIRNLDFSITVRAITTSLPACILHKPSSILSSPRSCISSDALPACHEACYKTSHPGQRRSHHFLKCHTRGSSLFRGPSVFSRLCSRRGRDLKLRRRIKAMLDEDNETQQHRW